MSLQLNISEKREYMTNTSFSCTPFFRGMLVRVPIIKNEPFMKRPNGLEEDKIMENVIYVGLFFDLKAVKSAVSQNGSVTLEKEIALPHVTLAFRPSDEEMQILQLLLGKEIEVSLNEFAYNDRNAGFRVSVVTPDVVVGNFLKGKLPHITTSVGAEGRPVDTPKLFDGSFENVNFVQVDSHQTIVGRVGLFCSDGQVHYES